MKGIRGSFRLGSLVLVAALLIAAMTAPAMAGDTKCPKLWSAIEITSVEAVEPVAVWDASDLLAYGDGSVKTSVGELKVSFDPLPEMMTRFFSGYRITATPSDNDPGTSKELGVKSVTKYVNHAEAKDMAMSGIRMNLEPGTKYYIEVVAVNAGLGNNYYILSEAQGSQDDESAITLLSPPFLGAYNHDGMMFGDSEAIGGVDHYGTGDLWDTLKLPVPGREGADHRGTHFLVHQVDNNLHGFRWLNPAVFGPYDHVWKSADDIGKKGADILCMDKDGAVSACGTTADRGKGKWDITKYRVEITNVKTGNVEYRQDVSLLGAAANMGPVVLTDQVATGTPDDPARNDRSGVNYYYEAFFNLADGEYDFSVQAGRIDDGEWRQMSGKAVVRFSIPGDYRKYNQNWEQWNDIVDEVAKGIDEESDRDRWFGSIWNIHNDIIKDKKGATGGATGESNQNAAIAGSKDVSRAVLLIANLNNIYD